MKLIVENLQRTFETPAGPIEVLKGIDLELDAGDRVAITGPSGSGKSTLLHLLATLDQPTGGSISVDGVEVSELEERELAAFRNRHVGLVFQDHHLLPQYNVLQNVLLPALGAASAEGRQARARALIGSVGLDHRLEQRPVTLSGGERQRVAIARALLNSPTLLLCDEPTGNLDGETAEQVTDVLFSLHDESNNVLMCVTHSESLAERFPKRLVLRGGRCSQL